MAGLDYGPSSESLVGRASTLPFYLTEVFTYYLTHLENLPYLLITSTARRRVGMLLTNLPLLKCFLTPYPL